MAYTQFGHSLCIEVALQDALKTQCSLLPRRKAVERLCITSYKMTVHVIMSYPGPGPPLVSCPDHTSPRGVWSGHETSPPPREAVVSRFQNPESRIQAVRDVRVRLNHHINQLSKVLMKEIEASPVDLSRVDPEPHAGQLGYSFNLEGQQKPANSRTTGRLLSVISRM